MRVKDWLEKNIRSFTLLPPVHRQTRHDFRPIRKGFRHLVNYGNLIDRFENKLAGWACTFSVEIPNDMTICAVP